MRFQLRGGGELSLHPRCVVHRTERELETLPLTALAGVRVAFERDSRRIGWGITLVLAAAVCFLLAGPLGRFAAGAAAEMSGAGAQGVARALEMLFHALEAFAAALPVLALACAAAGGMLGALGWKGETVLILALPGGERVYSVRGHDRQLMEFAELLAERLVARES
jgi:hypothetical protein